MSSSYSVFREEFKVNYSPTCNFLSMWSLSLSDTLLHINIRIDDYQGDIIATINNKIFKGFYINTNSRWTFKSKMKVSVTSSDFTCNINNWS